MRYELGEVVVYVGRQFFDLAHGDEVEIARVAVKKGEYPTGPTVSGSQRPWGNDADYELRLQNGLHCIGNEKWLRKRRPPEQVSEQPQVTELKRLIGHWTKEVA